MEWLRTSKLVRSIHLAIESQIELPSLGEEWRSMDLATSVLLGVRSMLEKEGKEDVVDTRDLAQATAQVLQATGFPLASVAYVATGRERRHRRTAMRSTYGALENGVLENNPLTLESPDRLRPSMMDFPSEYPSEYPTEFPESDVP